MTLQTPVRTVAAGLMALICTSAICAVTPKFLEAGKSYTISTFGGSRVAKVLDIDKEAGWIKIQVDKPRPETVWLNLNSVIAVNESTTVNESKPLPPIPSGK